MTISLEVKKFINSEYVGQFAEIELPVEAPEPKPKKEKAPKKPGKKLSFRRSRDRYYDDDYDDIEAELDREEEEERLGRSIPAQQPQQRYQQPVQPPQEEFEQEEFQQEEPEEEPAGPVFERVRIHYMDEGTGEPLLLIHSPGQSLYTWRRVFSRLALNYRVIALDLVGHGFSSRPENFTYTIDEHAKAIGLFMDAINIRSAHVMAFSMGCAYAVRLALSAPERIGKMVLLAPGGMSPEMPLPLKLLDSSLFGGVASMLYGVRTVEKVLSDCFFDLTQTMGPEVVDEYYKTISDKDSRHAVRDSFHNFDDESIVSNLRSLDAPVLMLQGAEDKWRTPEQTEIYHASMPYAGYASIRNAGHLLHEEKYEKIIAAVLEYIPAVQIDI